MAKLDQGSYFVLDRFKDKQKLYCLAREVILDGIEKIAGTECRRLVERDGLCNMHHYFPVDQLADLDLFVKGNSCIKEVILQLSFNIGRDDLRIPGQFFLEENPFAFKISYPHRIAMQSRVTNAEYHQKYSKLRKKIALQEKRKLELRQKSEDWRDSNRNNLLNTLKNFKQITAEKFFELIKLGSNQTLQTYQGFDRIANQPYAAKVHQPHIDSWYGAPLGGISLWWAIEGATEDNGVVLYPDFFGKAIDFENLAASSSYLPFGITLTKPCKIQVKNGHVLLFKYDMLHSSHLNISDFTRVAIVAQIYTQCKFNPDSIHERGTGFHSSEDIASGNWDHLVQISMRDNFGVLYEGRQKPHVEKRISVRINVELVNGIPICLCDSTTLSLGDKMLVRLQNKSIIVIRTIEGLRAIDAICPHMGINLIDGFHDQQNIYCPGHAVAYGLTDGSSKCDFLKLQVYRADDREGKIFLQKL
ncbi:MAG: Rieske 2Fe-2S domain-containing protein [Aphanocapsa sp. GSE-SYN-MK-11-07L]|nr:Rieske 2Fe-2S domain-containing protein [Aphanocapsa sp. GSE-SYN-MK-11-07L]